jgi:hypothetical protein
MPPWLFAGNGHPVTCPARISGAFLLCVRGAVRSTRTNRNSAAQPRHLTHARFCKSDAWKRPSESPMQIRRLLHQSEPPDCRRWLMNPVLYRSPTIKTDLGGAHTSTSIEGHGDPFSVTVGALVGAYLLTIMGWQRRNDPHLLRARCTKYHPGVSKDCPVRLVMLHSHDDYPSVGRG